MTEAARRLRADRIQTGFRRVCYGRVSAIHSGAF